MTLTSCGAASCPCPLPSPSSQVVVQHEAICIAAVPELLSKSIDMNNGLRNHEAREMIDKTLVNLVKAHPTKAMLDTLAKPLHTLLRGIDEHSPKLAWAKPTFAVACGAFIETASSDLVADERLLDNLCHLLLSSDKHMILETKEVNRPLPSSLAHPFSLAQPRSSAH